MTKLVSSAGCLTLLLFLPRTAFAAEAPSAEPKHGPRLRLSAAPPRHGVAVPVRALGQSRQKLVAPRARCDRLTT